MVEKGGSEGREAPSVGAALSAAGPSQGARAPLGGSEGREAPSVGALFLNAEALYQELLRGVRMMISAQTQLAGITSGGAWLAERLQRDLGRSEPFGVLSSAMHRDDYAKRGLSSGAQTQLPFEVTGADILVLDDVLYTGRTIRAVINELFDYGRPACVRLAVLVDRGGRELPVQADFAAARVTLAAHQSLALARAADGAFSFEVKER